MKDWFPFTDYDFYSYLFCGLLLLFGLDLWANGGEYLWHDNWSFIGSSIVIALAYVSGQIISIPSSIIFEHLIVRKILRPPALILLSENHSVVERFVEKYLIGRHYSPLPRSVVDKVFLHAAEDTRLSRQELEQDLKAVFISAIIHSRKSNNPRISFFRNQYSFSRNISFVIAVMTALFLYEWMIGECSWVWPTTLFVASTSMFIRFLKFYSCCATEVISSYAYADKS